MRPTCDKPESDKRCFQTARSRTRLLAEALQKCKVAQPSLCNTSVHDYTSLLLSLFGLVTTHITFGATSAPR